MTIRTIIATAATAAALAGCAATTTDRIVPADDAATANGLVVVGDWTAWVDRMPPMPARLHVSGAVRVDNETDVVTLTPSSIICFNPAILCLDLNVAPAPTGEPQGGPTRTVTYTEPNDVERAGVSVFLDGEMVVNITEIGDAH